MTTRQVQILDCYRASAPKALIARRAALLSHYHGALPSSRRLVKTLVAA